MNIFFLFWNDDLNSIGSIVTKTKYIHWRHLKVRKDKPHLSLCDFYLWLLDTSAHRWSYWLNFMWRSLGFWFFSSSDLSQFCGPNWHLSHVLRTWRITLASWKNGYFFILLYFHLRCLCTSNSTFKIFYWLLCPLPGSNFWDYQRWQENSLFRKMPIADKRWNFPGEHPQSSWCWVHRVKHLML